MSGVRSAQQKHNKSSVQVSRRGMWNTVVLCVVALLLALVTILVLNIQTSAAQYRLVGLSAEAKALAHENEALTQVVEAEGSPQKLALRAHRLGMVPSKDSGLVNPVSGEVVGDPAPAEKGKGDAPRVVASGASDPEKDKKKAEEESEKKSEGKDKKDQKKDAKAKKSEKDSVLKAPQQRKPGPAE